jgi:alkaline phosphatase D
MSIQGNWDQRTISRRHLLGWAGMGAGGLAVAASGLSPSSALAKPFFAGDPFSLGVASGDPLPSGVVLWTRLAPEPLAEDGSGGMPSRKVPVRWEVATDEAFRDVVAKGNTFATPELAHSVHVEVEGLRPGREYFYRFKTGPETSPVGRTKTAPAFGAPLEALSFAVVSCQAYQDGYYTAYRHIAEEDLDLVVHLGDYIYEGPVSSRAVRPHDGPEPMDLRAYRNRHALYRTDEDLQAAHAAFPWTVTFDDHEVDNNWARDDQDPDAASREAFLARRAAAFQAYYEHLPLRRSMMPRGPDLLIYRRLTFGDLAEFSVLDTRQYRDDQLPAGSPQRTDPQRTITGPEQERFVLDGLGRSQARWNVLAQQVFFAQRDFAEGPAESYSVDAWDGYTAARDRILDFVEERQVANPVVLTGDVHKHYAANLKADFDDPDSATVGTEFVCTSISTGGDGEDMSAFDRVVEAENEHILFTNRQRGYVRCSLDRERWQADFRVLPFVTRPGAPVTTRASFVVENGRPGTKPA